MLFIVLVVVPVLDPLLKEIEHDNDDEKGEASAFCLFIAEQTETVRLLPVVLEHDGDKHDREFTPNRVRVILPVPWLFPVQSFPRI